MMAVSTKILALPLPLVGLALTGCATTVSRPIAVQSTVASAHEATPAPTPTPTAAATDEGGPQVDNCDDSNEPECPAGAVPSAPAAVPAAARLARLEWPASSGKSAAAIDRAGITYFLPRQLVKITAKRTDPDVKKAIEALGKAQKVSVDAKKAHSALETEIGDIKAAIVENADNIPVRDMLLADLKEAEDALPAAKKAETDGAAAAAAAEDALATAARPATGTGVHSSMTIELLPLSADPAFGFRLDPKHSVFRDDKQKFELSPSGLLTSSDITTADRTADILAELAFVAGMAFSPGSSGLSRSAATEEEKKVCNDPRPVVAVIDLANDAEIERFNEDVRCLGLRLALDWNRVPTEGDRHARVLAPGEGLFYRVGIEVPLRIEYCGLSSSCNVEDRTSWLLKETKYVALPQAGPISYVPQRAGFMTTTKYKLGFKDGILVSYDSDRPSELLSVARVPGKLVDQVFEGASKIISLRTGYNDSLVAQSASDLATLRALAADQDAAETYRRCAAERRAVGASIAPCLDAIH